VRVVGPGGRKEGGTSDRPVLFGKKTALPGSEDARENAEMPRKAYTSDDIVVKLRQVDLLRSKGQTCAEAVRSIGVSEVTYRRWRAEFGGLLRTLRPPSK